MARADKSARISAAVAVFRAGDFPNCSKAAVYFNVGRTAVSRRDKGLTRSREEVNLDLYQCLTNTQEEVLIGYINILSNKGMSLISYIVKNLVEEIRKAKIDKN